MVEQKLGRELVGIQPSDNDIFSAFILFCQKGVPQDEILLAQGIKEASGKAPFLSRFIDQETGGLSEDTRNLIAKLQEGILLQEDGAFLIYPSKVASVTSSTRMYFKDPGVNLLKEAAEVAQKVWFPNLNPQ